MKTTNTKILLPLFLLVSALFIIPWRIGGVVTVEQDKYGVWLAEILREFKNNKKLPEISIQVFLQDNPKEIWEISNSNNKKIKTESMIRILNLIKETSLLNMLTVQDPDALVLHVKTEEQNFHAMVSKEQAMSNIKVLTLMKLMEQNNQNRQMRRKQRRLETSKDN